MELGYGLEQIDIIPLIGVVFQLLLFLMLTSGFVMQPGINVKLPKAVTSEVVKLKELEIVVSSENTIYLEGKVVTIKELKNLLAQVAKRKQSILIKSDRRVSLGSVVEIWDMCRDSGISQINIATNQE